MTFLRYGILTAVAATLATAGLGYSDELKITVELSGAKEVPPVETDAKGTTEVTYDSVTRKLSWELTYSNLSGPASAAHFHGPADDDENAPPVVPIANLESGAEGSAELTDAQAKALLDGKIYINVHTAANPGGEIRGQVKPAS